MKTKYSLFTIIALTCSFLSVQAVQLTNSGNWTTSSNWSSGAVPTSGDNVDVGNSTLAIGSVDITTGSQVSSFVTLGGFTGSGNQGTINISGGSLTSGSDLWIGYNNSSTGIVNQTGGSLLFSGGTTLGNASGTRGILDISGASSVFRTSSTLSLGQNAGATGLMTQAGGTVSNNAFVVGWGGYGSSTQTGGSNFISGDFYVGLSSSGNSAIISNGYTKAGVDLYLGNNSGNNSNTVQVLDGGTLFNRLGRIGQSGSSNTMIVSGTGSLFTNTLALYIGTGGGSTGNKLIISNNAVAGVAASDHFYLGGTSTASNNTLIVTDGGKFSIGTARIQGSNGLMVVSGAGSKWNNTGGSIIIGNGANSHNNTLLISNGGVVVFTNNLVLGNDGGSHTLRITSGGTMTNNNVSVGEASTGGANTIEVSGTGSKWVVNNGSIDIGYASGANGNNLVISNGGALSSQYLNVGRVSDNNKLTVSGAGSLVTNSETLSLGQLSGTGNNLTISNQGTVTTKGLTINSGNSVSLNGGTLVVSNALIINNGSNLQVGDGTQKAKLQLNNITGSTMNGQKAVINSNAIFAIGGAQSVTLSSLVSSYITTNVGSGFGGTGFLTGDYTYGNGATVAPGNSPGTFTQTGAVTFASLGNYDWEINSFGGTAGTDPGWDLFNISGTLDISATSGSKFNINLLSLTTNNIGGLAYDFNGTSSYSNKIAEATTITGFSADKFNINTAGFSNSYMGSWTVGVQGSALYLYYIAIPEPSTYAMFAMGLLISAYGLKISRARKQKA